MNAYPLAPQAWGIGLLLIVLGLMLRALLPRWSRPLLTLLTAVGILLITPIVLTLLNLA